jgi:hypothetical protein
MGFASGGTHALAVRLLPGAGLGLGIVRLTVAVAVGVAITAAAAYLLNIPEARTIAARLARMARGSGRA